MQQHPTAPAVIAEAQPGVQVIEPRVADDTPPVLSVASPEIAGVPPSAKIERPIAVGTPKRKARSTPGGGSEESALRESRTVELSDVPAKDALTRAGAKVSFDGNSMKVDTADSSAGRAGLRAGDVIESIDGKAVDSRTTVKGSAVGKRIRVLRDGKSVDIVIKN
jgi:hypothetical protein